MKLRCGKQLSEETKLLKNVCEMKSARVVKKKRNESCDINMSSIKTSHGGETGAIFSAHKAGASCGPALKTASDSRSAGSAVSGGSSVVHLAHKSVASCSPSAVRKHPQQTSASSVSLANSSRKSPNSTITRNVDLIPNCRASLNTSSIHLGRSSDSNSVDLSNKPSSADPSPKISLSIRSSIGSTAQFNQPLIVDVTNLRRNRVRETCSVVNSIIGEETESVEMVHEDNRLPIVKIPTMKRKHRDSSVEVIARNVKAKITDTPEHNQNDKHIVQEDDNCSVISLGSDEEVIVLDSTPIPRLDRNSASDIVVLETPPSGKQVPTSVAVIDLCSPRSVAKMPRKPKSQIERKIRRRSPRKSVNSMFKEYDSVLGNVRVGDLSSVRSQATCHGIVRSQAPCHGIVRSQAPCHGIVRSQAPCHGIVRSQAPCHGIAPFPIPPTVCSAAAFNSNRFSSIVSRTTYRGMSDATAPSASFASAQAVSSGYGRILDHTVINTSSRLGNNQMDLAPTSSVYGSNLYNPNPLAVRMGLRPIVIDGSNVAMGHTNGRIFSSRGLKICIDFFLKRNHKVRAFVPQFRRSSRYSLDTHILDQLMEQGLVSFTPSRKIGDRLVVPYDDRYIVQYAAECGGVIVSTDNYRDLLLENPTWRETIERRLLMFTWVEDVLIFPQDPLGRHGPNLERFLRFP